MELVTSGENTMRGLSPSARNAVKTHCKYGHEFTPENTLHKTNSKGPYRVCITCERVRHTRPRKVKQ